VEGFYVLKACKEAMSIAKIETIVDVVLLYEYFNEEELFLKLLEEVSDQKTKNLLIHQYFITKEDMEETVLSLSEELSLSN